MSGPSSLADNLRPAETTRDPGLPAAQGLYCPTREHDACGVGFVANMHNRKSHEIIEMGLQILLNLDHRGAVGADPKAGDGCGMLMQIPHVFFVEKARELGFALPAPGEYAVGALFLPRDPEGRKIVEGIVEKVVADEGQILLGWRDTPVDPSDLGESIKPTEPVSRQIFIGRGANDGRPGRLRAAAVSILRKVISNTVYGLARPARCRLLCRFAVVAHGRLQGPAARRPARRLLPRPRRPDFVSALALVHQRFSTNTFPTWSLAHPYRMVAHNGEINTLRGNVNWMAARQASVASALFGDDISQALADLL